ncbi:MAG: hypothetical protein ACRENU_07100 [Gemmatimonadaceae bacterium]
MQVTNARGKTDSGIGALRPAITPNRSWDRGLVREVCVDRSRAGFLGTRWSQLLDDATDPQLRALEEATRLELKRVVRRYARELLEIGESRSTMLVLVAELATQISNQRASASMSFEDVRDELVEWVRDVSPST